MSFCSNCGAKIADASKFCPSCGNATESTVAVQPDAQQATATPPIPTPAASGGFETKDIEQHKLMAILSYLGILVLIPIFGAKESPYARYHANQGLILCIAAILYSIAYSVLSGVILAISWRLYWVVSLLGFVGLIFAVLCVIGIINAANGHAKELPVIGKFKILK